MQLAGVVTPKVTGRPDVAVALTETGDWSSVLLASVPKLIVWFNGARVKAALQAVSAFRVTIPSAQSGLPDQPVKVDPAAAAALSVTTVPAVYDCEQSLPQLMPAGLLVTVPLPVPDRVTVSSGPTTQPDNETVDDIALIGRIERPHARTVAYQARRDTRRLGGDGGRREGSRLGSAIVQVHAVGADVAGHVGQGDVGRVVVAL